MCIDPQSADLGLYLLQKVYKSKLQGLTQVEYSKQKYLLATRGTDTEADNRRKAAVWPLIQSISCRCVSFGWLGQQVVISVAPKHITTNAGHEKQEKSEDVHN